MSRMNLVGWTLALALGTAGLAEAKQWKYAGMHPRTGHPKGGLCHIEVTHVHTAAPLHAEVLYRVHDGILIFIGDPTPFGYEGPRHAFYGHHPVVLDVLIGQEAEEPDVEYCYHDGPHYHAYPAPPEQPFEEQEDVLYYAGEYPPEYKRESPALARVNVVYRTWSAPRPVVKVAPPPEYHGPLFRVDVALPIPAVQVNVGPFPALLDVVHVKEEVIVHEVHEHHDHGHRKHKKHKHKKHKHRD